MHNKGRSGRGTLRGTVRGTLRVLKGSARRPSLT